MTRDHSSCSHYKNNHKFDLGFSVAVKMLIVLRHQTNRLLPFLVPIILSVHIPLGAYYEPVGCGTPATYHGIS